MQAVSSYVLQQRLESEGTISCDVRLRAVTGHDTLPLTQLGEVVSSHLSPSPPLHITYTIRSEAQLPFLPALATCSSQGLTPPLSCAAHRVHHLRCYAFKVLVTLPVASFVMSSQAPGDLTAVRNSLLWSLAWPVQLDLDRTVLLSRISLFAEVAMVTAAQQV